MIPGPAAKQTAAAPRGQDGAELTQDLHTQHHHWSALTVFSQLLHDDPLILAAQSVRLCEQSVHPTVWSAATRLQPGQAEAAAQHANHCTRLKHGQLPDGFPWNLVQTFLVYLARQLGLRHDVNTLPTESILPDSKLRVFGCWGQSASERKWQLWAWFRCGDQWGKRLCEAKNCCS